ncbi:unnamed protein product [Schistosoma curassoni]|uniref:Uncharacterized protein n=1 Tax=Schistosoma curassoni TaxID=6186 RepID=A0A183JCU1_9TREM|nr:unnamed protein product [Schistosoma curassoni]
MCVHLRVDVHSGTRTQQRFLQMLCIIHLATES